MDRDRARGALLGLAVGDALGTTLEFKRLEAPAFPNLCSGPHREIAGALLGAHHGAKAIPEAWIERVLAALKQRPGPLRDLYHPRRLLELLEDRG